MGLKQQKPGKNRRGGSYDHVSEVCLSSFHTCFCVLQ